VDATISPLPRSLVRVDRAKQWLVQVSLQVNPCLVLTARYRQANLPSWVANRDPTTHMPWEKNFDVDVALEKAGATFWSNGYEATSMRDLLEAMGIQKGSFYATYGSKRTAYLRSLEQYTNTRFGYFAGLIEGQAPKQSLETLINIVYEECTGANGHRGCMLLNCALELAHSDIEAQRAVQRGFEFHEQSYTDLIIAGQAAGEIHADLDAAATGKAMLAIVMGMRVLSRAGTSNAALQTLADQALLLLER
jgi:TetR/AcrR family transcriptional repressor of nem operon